MSKMQQMEDHDLFESTQKLLDCPEHLEKKVFQEWSTCLDHQGGDNLFSMSKLKSLLGRDQQNADKNYNFKHQLDISPLALMLIGWDWKWLDLGLNQALNIAQLGANPDFSKSMP